MDINLLVVNVGNSRLAIGVFSQGELTHVRRLTHDQRAEWQGALADAWGQLTGGPGGHGGAGNVAGAGVAGASVNPAANEAVEHLVMQATGQPVQWVGREIDLPIAVQGDAPGETGVDRVLGVAAAYEQIGKSCVVVDAGTALTVNCCDDKGNFLGGAIAPGAAMMLDALHNNTARLPAVTLAKPVDGIAKTTQEAMLQGVFHGARGLVKELAEAYAMQLGNWPEVICTGGDAELLFGGWELVHAVSPDLVLYGVALAYTEYYTKNPS